MFDAELFEKFIFVTKTNTFMHMFNYWGAANWLNCHWIYRRVKLHRLLLQLLLMLLLHLLLLHRKLKMNPNENLNHLRVPLNATNQQWILRMKKQHCRYGRLSMWTEVRLTFFFSVIYWIDFSVGASNVLHRIFSKLPSHHLGDLIIILPESLTHLDQGCLVGLLSTITKV